MERLDVETLEVGVGGLRIANFVKAYEELEKPSRGGSFSIFIPQRWYFVTFRAVRVLERHYLI